jgi:hypothetical protein
MAQGAYSLEIGTSAIAGNKEWRGQAKYWQ